MSGLEPGQSVRTPRTDCPWPGAADTLPPLRECPSACPLPGDEDGNGDDALTPGVAWDPQAAIYAALRAAGSPGCRARQTLSAGLALRLAEQGYIAEVSFRVAEGTPVAAIRAALAETIAGAAAQNAAPHQGAYKPAGDEQSDPDQTGRPANANASRKRSGPLVKRTRACLVCGAVFVVNFRHADTHRFCSAACRSRHGRRVGRSESPLVSVANAG